MALGLADSGAVVKTLVQFIAGCIILLSGPGLLFGGVAVMASDPCFARQFPPASCGPGSGLGSAWGAFMTVAGAVVIAVLMAFAADREEKKK
jgi:hypothetical protein